MTPRTGLLLWPRALLVKQVQLLKDRYDESVGQKNALMEESQMLQVGRGCSCSQMREENGTLILSTSERYGPEPE